MKIAKAQKIGDIGEATVIYLVSKNKDWIVRKQDKDFGIDLEMELVDKNVVSGQFVKVQVKASNQLKISKNSIKLPISNNFLKYCDECRVPVILALIDINQNKGFFIWVQEYLRTHQVVLNQSKTISINIPVENDFEIGLNHKIKNIALRLNETQLQLDLKASLKTSFLLGNEKIYQKLLSLSLGVAKTNTLEIEKIIEDLIELGNLVRGSRIGNQKAEILYSLCRQFGDSFSAKNIKKMVLRGKSYSRTGITALSILYEHFPKHTKSLNLPQQFDGVSDNNLVVAYYCKLRERYLGKSLPSILLDRNANFKIGRFDIINVDRSDLYLKWPNRGDSIILDYIYYK